MAVMLGYRMEILRVSPEAMGSVERKVKVGENWLETLGGVVKRERERGWGVGEEAKQGEGPLIR